MTTITPQIKTSFGRPSLWRSFILLARTRMKTTTKLVVAMLGFLAVAGPGFAPFMQAVVPAPDGGYPGGNTAEGTSSLFSLTTGTFNTAVGFLALRSNTEGNFNTAVGAGALLANVGDPSTSDGIQNTATGAGALLSNTTGEDNTANGAFALFSNTTGDSNTAYGAFALQHNTTGSFNIAMGLGALLSNTTGFENTAVGTNALVFNTEGNFNTAIGDVALRNNTTGGDNTAIGESALFHNTTGGNNTAIGDDALLANSTGGNNTAIGFQALSNSTGFNNVALGDGAGSGVTDANNVICIGHAGTNVDNSCFIGNIRDAVVAPDAVQVLIDSAGKLGTTSGSSRRFKTQIKPMDRTSEAIFALKPVTFHYKTDSTNSPQSGLIAEEVAKVNPHLVLRDKDGEIYTVRYDQVNAMLLNEFLKEHRRNEAQQGKIEEQDATIGQLKSALAQQQKRFESELAQQEQQIAALVTDLQRLAADVEVNKAEVRTVAEK
jgi:hypothetical protein